MTAATSADKGLQLGIILNHIQEIELAHNHYFGLPAWRCIEAEQAFEIAGRRPVDALKRALDAYASHSRWLQDGIYDDNQAARASKDGRKTIAVARKCNDALRALVKECRDLPRSLPVSLDDHEANAFRASVLLGFMGGSSKYHD